MVSERAPTEDAWQLLEAIRFRTTLPPWSWPEAVEVIVSLKHRGGPSRRATAWKCCQNRAPQCCHDIVSPSEYVSYENEI